MLGIQYRTINCAVFWFWYTGQQKWAVNWAIFKAKINTQKELSSTIH